MYGTPYMGSKNFIAPFVVEYLPSATHFYDLFAGGCAVTHCAMEKKKYTYCHANDIGDAPTLFKNAIEGKYKDEKRWISREDFFLLKDSDSYVRYCWSFGNNGKAYIYGRDIEGWRKALWYARVRNDFSFMKELGIDLEGDASRINIKRHSDEIRKKLGVSDVSIEKLQGFQRLESLQSLESLERLQRLQSLKGIPKLEITQGDYKDVKVEKDSVIYCDIPYRNTAAYDIKKKFNYEEFYSWVRENENLVIINEYAMPDDFVCVASVKKQVLLSKTADNKVGIKDEKLFVHKSKENKYYSKLGYKERSLFDDN